MSKLPTFSELARYEIKRSNKKQKVINIKIEIYTAKMMIEEEGKKQLKKSGCIHPNCECLDYCEALDPYSKTPIKKPHPKTGL